MRVDIALLVLLVGAAATQAASAQSASAPSMSPSNADTSAKAEATVRSESAASALKVLPLRPGLNAITGAGGTVVVATGPDGTVLVDSGLESAAPELYDLVERIAAAPLRFVIDTHGHADHTGGNAAAAARGAIVVGHESLRERTGRDAAVPAGDAGTSAAASRPMLTLADSIALHLNGDRIDVLHVADAHSAADLVVRWARADVVALGDVYWSHQYPAIDLDSGGSLAGMVAALEGALARTGARSVIVPGHGAPTGRAELAAWRDMLVAVGRKVREAVERGENLQTVLDSRPTSEFDARYLPPGAPVSADDFVRNVYADLTRRGR